MKHLRFCRMIALLLAACLSARAQEVPRAVLLAEADALYAEYDFAEALQRYHALLPGADSAQARTLGEKILLCENGLNLLRLATDPEPVAEKVVPIEDFFLYYSHLSDECWIPFPNDFVPEGQHPLYRAIRFERSRGEVVFSALDSTGGWHLRSSRLQGDTLWTQPGPLGEAFHSNGDEIYPLVSRDGKRLYFSSNALAGMGGYDLFVCERKGDGSWGEPKNLGFPYSSTADDLLFSTTSDGRLSLFASTRDCPPGSIRIYVVRHETTPVRQAVTSAAQARRRAALEKKPEPASSAEPVAEPAAQPRGNDMQQRYFRAVDSLETLERRLDTLTRELDRLREALRRDTLPLNRLQYTWEISEKEQQLLSLQAEHGDQTRFIRRMESGFFALGQVPPPIFKARPEPKPEPAAAPEEKLRYEFRKMRYGLLGDLPVEMPPIEEEPFDYTFRIGDVALFAPDNRRPDGLVYQIQLCATASKLPETRLKGLSPCFEFPQQGGKYIYAVGAFRHYGEAAAALKKVKALGWTSAFITAHDDGKAVSIKNARALESKQTKNTR